MTTSSTTGAGGTIVDEEPCCIDTLDPGWAWSTQSSELSNGVYQGLLTYAPNTTNIVPLLAESYNVSSDGLTYNFQLRQNVTFSNGDPFNAYVMWYSMYRAALMAQGPAFLITVSLNTTSVTADMLNQFNTTNNIPPQSLLQIMSDPTNAITATGPYSLQFHLMQRFAAFLPTLTQDQDFAVDPRVVSAHGGVTAGSTNSWMTVHSMGTGPWMMTDYQPNQYIVLERNPAYWGGANGAEPTPKLDKVIVKWVPNALTRLEDLQRGSAQIILLDPSLAPQLLGLPNTYVPQVGYGIGTVHLIGMNEGRFPFNNRLIRLAVVHAINFTALAQLFHGFGTTVVGPEPRSILGYASDLQPYSYNLTLSRQLLAQAGYPDGKGIPPVTEWAWTAVPPSVDVVSVIQAELAQIGINVKIITISTWPSVSGYTDPNYPDLTYDAYGYFPDPWAYANWWVGDLYWGLGGNYADYNNTQVINLLHQTDSALDPTQRAALYQQVAHLVYDDAPYIWVGQDYNAYGDGIPVVNINVRGYVGNIALWAGTDFSLLYLASPVSPTSVYASSPVIASVSGSEENDRQPVLTSNF